MTDLIMPISREYLTFVVGKEEFGVEILSVQEIRVWSPVTELPNTPEFFKGVINLRGTIVPIVDLRQRFRCGEPGYDNTTVVIVLQGEVRGKRNVTGIVVDAVSDVIKVEGEALKEAPDLGEHVDSCFISGMVARGERLTILLDAAELLDTDELMKSSGPIARLAG